MLLVASELAAGLWLPALSARHAGLILTCLRPDSPCSGWLPAGEGSGLDWCGHGGGAVAAIASGPLPCNCSTSCCPRCMPFPPTWWVAPLPDPASRSGDGDGPLRVTRRRCCHLLALAAGGNCAALAAACWCAALRPCRWPSAGGPRPNSLVWCLRSSCRCCPGCCRGSAGAGWGWLAWASTLALHSIAAWRRPRLLTGASMGGRICCWAAPGSRRPDQAFATMALSCSSRRPGWPPASPHRYD